MKVYGIARLVKEPEVKELEKSKVIKMRLASDEGYGEGKKTLFIDADYFVSADAKIDEYLEKGREIFVEGYLLTEEWENSKGEKRSKISLRVTNLKLLGGGKGSKEEPGPEPAEVVDDDEFEF